MGVCRDLFVLLVWQRRRDPSRRRQARQVSGAIHVAAVLTCRSVSDETSAQSLLLRANPCCGSSPLHTSHEVGFRGVTPKPNSQSALWREARRRVDAHRGPNCGKQIGMPPRIADSGSNLAVGDMYTTGLLLSSGVNDNRCAPCSATSAEPPFEPRRVRVVISPATVEL
jgi:hypothetical protein